MVDESLPPVEEEPFGGPSFGEALRAGFALGLAWAVVHVSLARASGRVPLTAASVELLGDTVLWSVVACALAAVLGQLPARFRHPRVHPILLAGGFLALYPAMAMHATLGRTSQGALQSLALNATLLVVPLLAALAAPRLAVRPAGPAPAAAWILVAAVMAGLYLLERSVVGSWEARAPKVATMLVAGGAAQLSVAACLLRLPSRPWLGLRTVSGVLVASGALLMISEWRSQPSTALAGATDGPPVILISLDTPRPDHLSFFGYPQHTSPHLDAFLDTAKVFDPAYTSSSWTLPSHASAFSGLLPSEHGAHQKPGAQGGDLPLRMRDGVQTLAERYAARGYATGAVSANRFAVSPELGLSKGFQHLEAQRRLRSRPIHLTFLAILRQFDTLPVLVSFAEQNHDARNITNRALEWVEPHAEEPFFLFLNYLDPHMPYTAPVNFGEDGERQRGWFSESNRKSLSSRTRAERTAAYDGEIAYMDRHLKRLFDGLRRMGVYERSVIVVFSDHGEYLWERGGLEGHGKSVDEPVIRALLAVRRPGSEGAGPGRGLATLHDIPRFVDAAVAGEPIEGTLLEEPRVVSEKFLTASERNDERWPGAEHLVAVRWRDFKLVAFEGGAKLFDVNANPWEPRNVADDHPDVRDFLAEHARSWLADSGTAATEVDSESSEEVEDMLRALGYAE